MRLLLTDYCQAELHIDDTEEARSLVRSLRAQLEDPLVLSGVRTIKAHLYCSHVGTIRGLHKEKP